MKRFLLAMLCVSLLGMGCGGDDDDDDNSNGTGAKPGTSEPVMAKKMITADEGGEVKAGEAALKIPAGALGEDTEITVKTVDLDDVPTPDDLASDPYDFGPDGTTFEKPVELTLEFAGSAPKGMEATIAWLDGDKWVALEDSEVSGGKVVATTTHFTTFAVVWVSVKGGGGEQAAGQCGGDDEVSCGGALVGTWAFDATCVTLPPDLFKDPSNEALSNCAGIKVAADFEQTGSITFNTDKTYKVHSMTSGTVNVSIPKSCLMGAACQDQWKDGGDTCDAEMVNESKTNDEVGTYAVDGHTFTTTDDEDGTASEPIEYCVKGGTLTARVTDGEGTVQVFTAKKQ
jgi:hypothetical protein